MSESIEIPMFRFEEAIVVESLFARAGVRWRKNVVHLGADRLGGRHAYTFRVPEDDFEAAIALLKEAFGLRTGEEGVSGACPACGAGLADAQRCPECDLNVSSDYTALRPGHPFLRFLKQRGLL